MDIIIATDQRMEYEPTTRIIWRNRVRQHGFVVKCRAHVCKTIQNHLVGSRMLAKIEQMNG